MRFLKSAFFTEISSITFAALYSIAVLILHHNSLFSFAATNLDYHSLSGIFIFLELALAQFAVVFLLALLLSFAPPIVKPICIIFLISNSLACYFTSKYNVILDKTMMGNVFNTDIKEASDLYSPMIFLHVVALGILPSLLLAKIKIQKNSAFKRFAAIGLTLLITVIVGYLNSKSWLWFDKNAKRVGGLSMPFSYTINSIRYAASMSNKGPAIQIPNAHFVNNHKTTVILVIGESARKKNFSLYGYARETNPLLKKDDVVVMRDTKSCATYTTEAVRCILSHLGSHASSRTLYEPLTSYLQRSGINVLWRSNNWGDPKMQVTQYEKANEIRAKCTDADCTRLDNDEALLYKLDDYLNQHHDGNNLIVLHQTGSHGPLYYNKYPTRFESFKPICKSVDLQKCSHEELINAYDNTIIYNDFFLHKTITMLKNLKNSSTVMMYISDHGESLGEYNLYLHGMPYSLAPDVQKEIPFLIWMSDKFKQEHHVTNQDLAKQEEHLQDNVFHSVMGAFGMTSQFYDKNLDVFNGDGKK